MAFQEARSCKAAGDYSSPCGRLQLQDVSHIPYAIPQLLQIKIYWMYHFPYHQSPHFIPLKLSLLVFSTLWMASVSYSSGKNHEYY